MKFLVVGLLVAMSVTANARSLKIDRVELISAYVDTSTEELVLVMSQRKSNSCNPINASLLYKFSNKRKDGPHLYDLKVLRTLIGCESREEGLVYETIRLPLPTRVEDQTINISFGNKTLVYRTARPLTENVKIYRRKSGGIKTDPTIGSGSKYGNSSGGTSGKSSSSSGTK